MSDSAPDVLPPEETRELIAQFKGRLKTGSDALRAAYEAHPLTDPILKGRSHLVDGVLLDIWRAFGIPASAALVAVGGYGREELFPCSDVDLLFLLQTIPFHTTPLTFFLAVRWHAENNPSL